MATTCKPNRLHLLIDSLAGALAARGVRVTLVTQNIDDLHIKPDKDRYEYHAIHGNVKFVRCANFHLTPYQQFREELKSGAEVQCPQCQSLLRPHVLFFDESYGPLYGDKVKERTFPLVILIGTSLSTGLCSSFAQKAD
jgi:NAD-dependent deacetylase